MNRKSQDKLSVYAILSYYGVSMYPDDQHISSGMIFLEVLG